MQWLRSWAFSAVFVVCELPRHSLAHAANPACAFGVLLRTEPRFAEEIRRAA
jgi:hypothetical protein